MYSERASLKYKLKRGAFNRIDCRFSDREKDYTIEILAKTSVHAGLDL